MNMFNKRLFNKHKGFTLIELIVVIAVIGILVLLAAPKFLGYVERTQVTRILHDTKVVDNKVEETLAMDKEVFDGEELTHTQFLSLINDGKVFGLNGKVLESNKDLIITDTYKKISPEIVKASKTGLKGNFYLGSGGKMYYEHTKSLGGKDEGVDELLKEIETELAEVEVEIGNLPENPTGQGIVEIENKLDSIQDRIGSLDEGIEKDRLQGEIDELRVQLGIIKGEIASPADKSELNTLIIAAENELEKPEWSEESKDALRIIINDAKTLMDNPNSTKEAVDAMKNNIGNSTIFKFSQAVSGITITDGDKQSTINVSLDSGIFNDGVTATKTINIYLDGYTNIYTSKNVSSTSTSILVQGLTNGVTSTFRVELVNSIGDKVTRTVELKPKSPPKPPLDRAEVLAKLDSEIARAQSYLAKSGCTDGRAELQSQLSEAISYRNSDTSTNILDTVRFLLSTEIIGFQIANTTNSSCPI